MADQLQLRGGTTAQTATFTGALREVTVDTDKDTLVVHDNALAGGYPLLRQDLSNLPAGTIDNADINASAAIVDTKLATIATAGKVSNSATTAASANTASAIVARDASGNFTAGTITAALTGAASANVLKAGDTMTGPLVTPAGTVTANGIQVGTGTTYKPGIYSPGADQLAISTAGTRRLVVDANGNIALGSATVAQYSFLVNKNITGAVTSFGVVSQGTIQSDVTTSAIYYNTFAITEVAAFNLNDLHHYRAQQATFGAGSTVTNQFGFSVANSLSGATNNYGFYSALVSGTGRYNFYAAGTADSYFASNNFIWANGGSEKARLDSSGRLLVGTSSVRAVGDGFQPAIYPPQIYLEQPSSGLTPLTCVLNRDDTNGPRIVFGKSRGTAVGSSAIVLAGDNLGSISFAGADGVDLDTVAAKIAVEVDGTPGANDMPGRLVFSTTADGAASPTEAMRITNDRVLAYNQPTPATYAAAATLTVADLKTKIITYTGAAATLTLPTGTLTEGGFIQTYTNMTFEWSVINTGAGVCTIGAGTAHTIVGSATVAIGASARFASRRTAANTFVSYCLS